jgi:hypothetical protein
METQKVLPVYGNPVGKYKLFIMVKLKKFEGKVCASSLMFWATDQEHWTQQSGWKTLFPFYQKPHQKNRQITKLEL